MLLQMDIDVLVEWSNKWLLHFNPHKCMMVSLRHSLYHHYSMSNHNRTQIISITSEEKDLGIFVTDNLKPSIQCIKAAAIARSILGMVRRNVKRLDREDFLLIGLTRHIRPHLEYFIQRLYHICRKIFSVLTFRRLRCQSL